MKLLTILWALLLAASIGCQPKYAEIDERVWASFLRTVDFQREYAMKRSLKDIPYLRRALKEESQLVRFNAAQDLASMDRGAERASPELVQCLAKGPAAVSALCYKIISSFSPLPDDAIPALLEQVNTEFSSTTNRAQLLLGNVGEGATSHGGHVAQSIASGLESDLGRRRAMAARLAGMKDLRPLEARLFELLDDTERDVRISAALGLSYLGVSYDSDTRIKAALEEAVMRSSGYLRTEAAEKLGKQIPTLAQRQQVNVPLENKTADPVAKRETVEAKGKSISRGSGADELLPIRVSQQVVRIVSRRKLQQREPQKLENWERQIPFLKSTLSNGSDAEKVAAIRVIGAMADYMDEALPLLQEALQNENAEVKARAATLLGEHRVEQATADLRGLLSHDQTRRPAAIALLRIGTPNAVSAARAHLGQNEVQQIIGERLVLRGTEELLAREVRQLCDRELSSRGFQGEALQLSSRECVQASGALY